MHENSQYQRVNNSMSNDSSFQGSSKCGLKKTPFYKHDDPSKLNYYARFSPKRKALNEQFEQNIFEGSSPLSPKTSRASSSQKKSKKSVKRKVFKDQSDQYHKNKFQLFDPNILLSINQNHAKRTQIYIDEDESSQQEDFSNKKNQNGFNGQIQNNFQPARFHNRGKIIDVSIYENPKESSESQQSSSFERMVEQSSSQENDLPLFLASKTSGGQMLIQDDEDSETETEKNQKIFKVEQSSIKILDGSEKKILQLAKSIGAYKKVETSKKQAESQNISFSIDSDLSQMEQKWNSYFQSGHDDNISHNESSKRQIFSENILQQKRQHNENFQQNDRKMSESSQEQLPSFSHPDTSSYHITPLESHRSSTCSEEAYDIISDSVDSQTKQFKRQFTFGNQLNAEFQDKMSQSSSNKQLKQPLFKKFLQKSTIENFKNKNSQKKQRNKNPLNQSAVNSAQIMKQTNKGKFYSKKSLSLYETRKKNVNNAILIFPQSPKVEQKQIHQQIISQESQHCEFQSKNTNQILIIEEQQTEEQPIKAFSHIKINSSQEEQQQPLYQGQQQQKAINNEIRIDETEQTEQKMKLSENQQKTFFKVNKQFEPTSYSKIFSEKKIHRIRKGSYNDRVKISQSQYQSSQEQQSSQRDNKYSQPKSQGGQSITTATQEVNQNSQIWPHYFLKNRSNCIQQVENLKKYLQKIENSPLSGKQMVNKKGTFDFNESFQSQGNEKDSKNQSFQSSYFNKNSVFPQSYQQKKKTQFPQELQTPIKAIENLSDIKSYQLEEQQTKMNEKLVQISNHRSFQKSLTMLESLIPHQTFELSRIYEKIYTQVYEQELKYQQKLQRQDFLISFMQDFIEAQNQKINCQHYLVQQFESLRYEEKILVLQVIKGDDERQILINKHLILALIRQLAES